MIKCFFVDVKSIKSYLPKSHFIESELEQLADLLLEVDGLLRPLILKQTKAGKYTVIAGHREYYAAVRAKEKNLAKAEMVNAFVIDTSTQKSAIAQLALLSGESLSNLPKATDEQLSLAQVLPIIESQISQQLQPILDQLTAHEGMLEVLTATDPVLPAIASTIADRIQPILDRLDRHNELLATLKSELQELKEIPLSLTSPSTTSNEITIEPVHDLPRSPNSNSEDISRKTKSEKVDSGKLTTPTINQKIAQASDPVTTAAVGSGDLSKSKDMTAPKSNPKNKTGSDFLASIDSTKATTTLNLINTLDRTELTFRMERSGLKAIVKLVSNIIDYRNTQANQIVDNWETLLSAKITGLTAAAIKKIIDKLK